MRSASMLLLLAASAAATGQNARQGEVTRALPQGRYGNALQSSEATSRAALTGAQAAYAAGDFDRAQALLQYVQSPAGRQAADQILTNIQVYRGTMREAEIMAQNGDYRNAAAKYGFAAVIQARGPGQPLLRQREALDAATRADAEKTHQTDLQRAQAQQAAALAQATAAQQAETTARIRRLLAAGRRMEAAKDERAALRAYEGVLKLSPAHKDALAGQRRVLASIEADSQALEENLEQGVNDFFTSRFAEANDLLQSYVRGGGKLHSGAAHFFLGATLVSQALLQDPGDGAKRDDLKAQAQEQFALARQQHYDPPQESLSPKVLGAWFQADAQRE